MALKNKNAFPLVEFLGTLAARGQRVVYEPLEKTLTVFGDLTDPVKGFDGDLRVEGRVRASVDITGSLSIGGENFEFKPGLSTGIEPREGGKINVRAGKLTVGKVSAAITGAVDIAIKGNVLASPSRVINGGNG